MNNHNDGKFTVGLLLGLMLGGGAVFLLGTRTGKNLLKIISEQGLDGLLNLLKEYNFDDLGEYEEVDNEEDADLGEEHLSQEGQESSTVNDSQGLVKEAPKKRFVKRIRK